MPTMAGAFVYDLYKNIDLLTADDFTIIGIGFVTAFISAVFVVRGLLDFVSKHGFTPFAIWRIFIGTVGLIGLQFF
jgi:undecaprenyl-diphosphatase